MSHTLHTDLATSDILHIAQKNKLLNYLDLPHLKRNYSVLPHINHIGWARPGRDIVRVRILSGHSAGLRRTFGPSCAARRSCKPIPSTTEHSTQQTMADIPSTTEHSTQQTMADIPSTTEHSTQQTMADIPSTTEQSTQQTMAD